VQLILLFTWIDYSGNKYGDYEFPAWANALGWAITFSSVILIPVVAVVKVYQETGTFSARLRKLTQPSYDWGPASPQHKRLPAGGAEGLLAGPGSSSTLTTTPSAANIKDIRDTNFCSLEPLSEDYEEDTSSEDDGLNMRAIREAAKQQTKQ